MRAGGGVGAGRSPARAQLVESDVLLLDASCRELGIPLVVARSYGLFGLVRNSVAVRRALSPPSASTPDRSSAGAPGGGVQAGHGDG